MTTRGFTILELLVATGIAVTLIALSALVWDGVYRVVERSRTIALMDIKARLAVDRTLRALDNRSGVYPMAAQNETYSRNWFFNLRVNLSRAHIDQTGGSQEAVYRITTQAAGIPPNSASEQVDVLWSRPQDPNWIAWKDSGVAAMSPQPGIDAYSPGKQVKTLTVGRGGHRWGIGEVLIWHGAVSKRDKEQRFRTGTAISSANPWRYDSNIAEGWISRTTVNQDDSSALIKGAYAFGRRYTGLIATDVTNNGPVGPFRNVTVLPTNMWDGANGGINVAWLGRTHIMRAIGGPAFAPEPWIGGRYVPVSTGWYGFDGAANYQSHREPVWYPDGMAATAPVVATDPAQGQPRPPYGTIVQDGGVAWRVEAPFMHYFETTGGVLSSVPRLSDNGKYNLGDLMYTGFNHDVSPRYKGMYGLLSSNNLGLRRGGVNSGRALSGLGVGWDYGSQYDISAYASNISSFHVRTSRVSGIGPAGTLGRFGSVADASWAEGSSWNLLGTKFGDSSNFRYATAAAFMGNFPTANEPPGHPRWVSVNLGLVAGFQASTQSALERRWTLIVGN